MDPSITPVLETIDATAVSLPGDEAYRLVATTTHIQLSARCTTGLRWARATLAQLRRHQSIPCLVIDDAPRFAHRGVMLDISRDRVPTMATLFDLVDRLAAWKMNRLQLYVEHTLAYVGHEEAWHAASPLTLEELAALDAYAADRGVALDANQNCLGHMERWLRHPRYAPLGEVATGQFINGSWYLPPSTLNPSDPGSLRLVDDLLRQQLPLCSGIYANIGCDEPFDLGLGRSRDLCAQRGRGRVFSDYVSQVAACALRLGKRPQFWCDPDPNEGEGLPTDLVALVWSYEDYEEFAPRIQAHRVAGREAWVAPGTSGNSAPLGRTWNLRGNLDRAAATTDATGFLSTHWGGHFQWPFVLFGFAEAAMAAWSGPGRQDDLATGLHCFGSPELGSWMARLGDLDAPLCRGERQRWDGSDYGGRAISHTSAFWRELQTQLCDRQGEGDDSAWEEIAGRLAAHARSMPAGLPTLLSDECRFSCDLAAWIAERAILRRGEMPVPARMALASRMAVLVAEYRRLWMKRSRYGGLEDSARFLAHSAHNW